MTTTAPSGAGLRVLVVDDEKPTVDELTWLLQRDPRVGEALSCTAATEALRTLQETEVDAIFLDISMPGLSGLELAQILSRFKQPPRIVFVTAHEQHAVEAFDLRAVDYVLKPVRPERLAEAVRRKLVLEIAGAQDAEFSSLHKAYSYDCMIGEKIWERNFGGFFSP